MKKLSLHKFTTVTTGLAIAAALASGAAHAQMSATPGIAIHRPGMNNPGINNAEVLSSKVLKAHQADLEAMITDLSKVKSPDVAVAYEGYLAGQMEKYTQNHKRLHHVAMKNFDSQKRMGRPAVDQQKLAEDVEKLNETHFARLADEMERVEKLHPGLKKHFDVLRTLN